MKLVKVLCAVVFGLILSGTKVHSRSCTFVLETCVVDCEEGTHVYAIGCGYLTPEATCDEPTPKEDKSGMICDYSTCYCDSPTVRDTVSGKCVNLEQCPKKE